CTYSKPATSASFAATDRCAKPAKKHSEEVLRHAAPVARRRAHVVDGRDFTRQFFLRHANRFLVECAPAEKSFRLCGSQDRGSYAAKRETDVADRVTLELGRGGDANFR